MKFRALAHHRPLFCGVRFEVEDRVSTYGLFAADLRELLTC